MFKGLIMAVLVALVSVTSVRAGEICFRWDPYEAVEATSFTLYKAALVEDGLIVEGSEVKAVEGIPITDVTVCTLKDKVETIYWLAAVAPDGSESYPSNGVRYERKYPEVPERRQGPKNFKK